MKANIVDKGGDEVDIFGDFFELFCLIDRLASTRRLEGVVTIVDGDVDFPLVKAEEEGAM